MSTVATSAADSRARLVRFLVETIQKHGYEDRRNTWRTIEGDSSLWREVVSMGLDSLQRQAWLSRIAFPITRAEETHAALTAGNNINRLYAIALGKEMIATDATGKWMRGKRGFRIVPVR